MKLFDPDKNGFPVSGEENPPYHVVKCSFEKEESVVFEERIFYYFSCKRNSVVIEQQRQSPDPER